MSNLQKLLKNKKEGAETGPRTLKLDAGSESVPEVTKVASQDAGKKKETKNQADGWVVDDEDHGETQSRLKDVKDIKKATKETHQKKETVVSNSWTDDFPTLSGAPAPVPVADAAPAKEKKVLNLGGAGKKPAEVTPKIEEEYFPTLGADPLPPPPKKSAPQPVHEEKKSESIVGPPKFMTSKKVDNEFVIERKTEPTPAPAPAPAKPADKFASAAGPVKFTSKKADGGEKFAPIQQIEEKVITQPIPAATTISRTEKLAQAEKPAHTEKPAHAEKPAHVDKPVYTLERNAGAEPKETAAADGKLKFFNQGAPKFTKSGDVGEKLHKEYQKSEAELLREQKERETAEKLEKQRAEAAEADAKRKKEREARDLKKSEGKEHHHKDKEHKEGEEEKRPIIEIQRGTRTKNEEGHEGANGDSHNNGEEHGKKERKSKGEHESGERKDRPKREGGERKPREGGEKKPRKEVDHPKETTATPKKEPATQPAEPPKPEEPKYTAIKAKVNFVGWGDQQSGGYLVK